MNRMPGWYKLGSGGPTAVGGGSPVWDGHIHLK
jgi:hypothetical protein